MSNVAKTVLPLRSCRILSTVEIGCRSLTIALFACLISTDVGYHWVYEQQLQLKSKGLVHLPSQLHQGLLALQAFFQLIP